MDTSKGHFIVFEGIDGSGKTTQINLLKKRIENCGLVCHNTKEPTDGPVGSLLRQCLTENTTVDEITLAALFAADRTDHIFNTNDGLLKKINEGITVLSDRYILSTYAYQSVKVPLQWVMEVNSVAAGTLHPDCHIFIDINPCTAIERITNGRSHKELFENENRLKEVRNKYFELFSQFENTENIIIIDGTQSIEKISDDIWKNVSRYFTRKGGV